MHFDNMNQEINLERIPQAVTDMFSTQCFNKPTEVKHVGEKLHFL